MSDVSTEELDGIEIEAEVKPKAEFSRDTFEVAQKEKAASKGWVDYDDFVESGGDPAKWRSAEAFNLYGEMVGELKKTRQDFDSRLEGVHNLAQAQLKAQREQLLAERDALIDEGGRGKEVNALDKKIDALNVPQTPQRNALLDEWNSNNPWIFEDSPKSTRAYAVYANALQTTQSVERAIQAVEADIAKHFPTASHKPGHVPESERGTGSKGFGKQTKTPTMADLTDDEKLAWKVAPEAWGNDKNKFLQAVADDRKAAKR